MLNILLYVCHAVGDLNWSGLGLDLVSTTQSISFVSISIHSWFSLGVGFGTLYYNTDAYIVEEFYFSHFSKQEGS